MTEPAANSPRILGLFAKRPRPAQAKTRLAAHTSPAWAAEAANAFLLDLVDKFAEIADERFLVYAPADEGAFFARVTGLRYKLLPQPDGDLGRRMHCFFDDRLRTGMERVVVLGSDSPTVPPAYVEQAFQELETADVAVGPAMDGGYYLLGCARRIAPVFTAINWGSPTVLAETIARLANSHWRLAVLPPWYDVDTLDDWHVLCGHLLALRRAGIDPDVPRTERLMQCPRP